MYSLSFFFNIREYKWNKIRPITNCEIAARHTVGNFKKVVAKKNAFKNLFAE